MAKYTKSKIQRDHEIQLALMNMMAKDPELKYYLGMAAGAGISWIADMLTGNTTPTGTEDSSTEAARRASVAFGWLATGGVGGVAGLVVLEGIAWDSSEATGISGQMANILKLGGTSFAGTCAMILILRAIFSGTDLGELLNGIGEIAPL